MKFICIEDCIDSGDLQHLSKRETPITHNYRVERIYDINEETLKRLTAIGLFPEFFEFGDEAATAYVDSHNDELCDIVDARVLPYRKLTPEEEANDRLVAKTGEGKYTLPHGVVAISRPKLIRRGKVADSKAPEGEKGTVRGPISLERGKGTPEKPPVTSAKTGRKPMSAENRKKAGERLAAARQAKKLAKVGA